MSFAWDSINQRINVIGNTPDLYDLRNLTSAAGVTTKIISGVTHYYITKPIYLDRADSILTIDPEKECLVFDLGPSAREALVIFLGTLNIGKEKTINNYKYYSIGTAIIASVTNQHVHQIRLKNLKGTPRINWYGATVILGGYFTIEQNTYFTAKNAKLVKISNSSLSKIIFMSERVNIDGFRYDNYDMISIRAVCEKLKGLEPITPKEVPIQSWNSSSSSIKTPQKTFIEIENYKRYGVGTGADCTIFSNVFFRFLNSETGTNLNFIGQASLGNSGIIEIVKEVNVKVLDDSGYVNKASCFIKDKDNGDRVNFDNANSYRSDRLYFAQTKSDGTLNNDFKVLLGVAARGGSTGRSSSVAGSTAIGLNIIDIRGETGARGEDHFTMHFWSYLHKYKSTLMHLNGKDKYILDAHLDLDETITEKDVSKVSAYTGISVDHINRKITITSDHNLEQIHDYLKYNKTLQSNISLPKPDEMCGYSYGDVIDFLNYDFKVDGCTLLKGSKYTAVLTKGAFELANNGKSEVLYKDIHGYYIRFTSDLPMNILVFETGKSYRTYYTNVKEAAYEIGEDKFIMYAAWSSGYKTICKKINRVDQPLEIKLNFGQKLDVDTTKDISSYFSKLSFARSNVYFDVITESSMVIPSSIEAKQLFNIISGTEVFFKFLMEDEKPLPFSITELGITLENPSFRLLVSNSLRQGKVDFGVYINLVPALTINKNFIINPPNSSNLFAHFIEHPQVADNAAIAQKVKEELIDNFSELLNNQKNIYSVVKDTNHKVDGIHTNIHVDLGSPDIVYTFSASNRNGFTLLDSTTMIQNINEFRIKRFSGQGQIERTFISTRIPTKLFLTVSNPNSSNKGYIIETTITDSNDKTYQHTWHTKNLGQDEETTLNWVTGLGLTQNISLKKINFKLWESRTGYSYDVLNDPIEIKKLDMWQSDLIIDENKLNSIESKVDSIKSKTDDIKIDASNKVEVVVSQNDFDDLMDKVPNSTKNSYKSTANPITENSIVNRLLDVPYGKRTDGSNLQRNSLGEHFYNFYPPEIIRQLLILPLNSDIPRTRFYPNTTPIPVGSIGDALKKISVISSGVSSLDSDANILKIDTKYIRDNLDGQIVVLEGDSITDSGTKINITTALIQDDDFYNGYKVVLHVKNKRYIRYIKDFSKTSTYIIINEKIYDVLGNNEKVNIYIYSDNVISKLDKIRENLSTEINNSGLI
jgi:hypothetical protein